jgi:eukaryotic-like serine/threonine-protein kinase
VLDALGEATSKLRSQLGESLASVQKLDVPLDQATTSSLEALQAYSLGMKASETKGPAAALPYDQRAIELDPNFAAGYRATGRDYINLGQTERARDYFTKAFQLRGHSSEREKLEIAGTYYLAVTGELDKAAQTFQEFIEGYPRWAPSYNFLGLVYAAQGKYEKAAEMRRKALSIADQLYFRISLASDAIALQHFDEAREVIRDAQTRKMDDATFRLILYSLAFLRGDSSGMAEQELAGSAVAAVAIATIQLIVYFQMKDIMQSSGTQTDQLILLQAHSHVPSPDAPMPPSSSSARSHCGR